MRNFAQRIVTLGIFGVVLLIVVGFILGMLGGYGYLNHGVGSDQVAIKFVRNQPVEVIGPGVYGAGPFQFNSIQNISIHGLPFTVVDPEVITGDKYRIAATVTGTVLRPGMAQAKQLLADWGSYRQFYEQDTALIGDQKVITQKGSDGKDVQVVQGTPGLMQNFGQQALKVCIGDRTFDKVVIGTARDEVRDCVDKEMTSLSSNYALTIVNVVVPQFGLSPQLQQQLDAQSAATQAVAVAQQTALQKKAEADATLAQTTGAIRVEQSKAQEEARQAAITAGLATDAAKAKQAQIEAEKANDLLSAQKDKDINTAQAAAAAQKAQAELAPTIAQAKIYQDNPAYADYQKTVANAQALKATDKVYYLPPGTNPVVISGQQPGGVVVNPGSSPNPSPSPSTKP